jgi:uncharacterized HAD superfamily protein
MRHLAPLMAALLHIYIDVDDVLAQTTHSIAELAARMFGTSVAFEEMHTFDLSVSLGLSSGEYEALMEAAHEPDFLTSLEPMVESVRVVSSWQASGARIGIVTGRPPSAQSATERWLAKHAIPFDDLDFVDKYGRYPGTGSRALDDRGTRDYAPVIEDTVGGARPLAQQNGMRVALFDRPWNRKGEPLPESVVRVETWHEIEVLASRLS